MPKQSLSVGEVAERSGLPISTLHFYERKGLISPTRNGANHRVYGREILRLVTLIKVAQRAGVQLAEIADALKSLPQRKTPSQADWERLSSVWHVQLSERITTLQALRDNMGRCIGCGCLSMRDCPLVNDDDHLASKGPGAHLL